MDTSEDDTKLCCSVLEEDSSTGVRPLHACLTPHCDCTGVFYAEAVLSARICARVTIIGSLTEEMRAYFREQKPTVTNADMSPVYGLWVWKANARLPGGGSWDFLFRPPYQQLHQLLIVHGSDSVYSRCYHVRTKPSQWVIVHRTPTQWAEADVRKFVAKCLVYDDLATVVILSEASACIKFSKKFLALRFFFGWRDRVGNGTTPAKLRITWCPSFGRAFRKDPALGELGHFVRTSASFLGSARPTSYPVSLPLPDVPVVLPIDLSPCCFVRPATQPIVSVSRSYAELAYPIILPIPLSPRGRSRAKNWPC